MSPYLFLVSEYARLAKEGKSFPLGGFPPTKKPEIPAEAPKVLFFAPHPDDETIQGGLALRMLRECKWNVINVAVTQGSKKDRQAGRLQELKGACNYLGFGLEQLAPAGLENVSIKTRSSDPGAWVQMVKIISDILEAHKPQVIFFPHEHDWNGTHIGVHFLLLDAMKSCKNLNCFVVETEFWGQMQSPNLLVEYTANDVADLISATSFHIGEVKRNPYHILIPAWMQDNVRRGAELVGGQGGAAPDFVFAQLYRARKWSNGGLENIYEGGQWLSAKENPETIFAQHKLIAFDLVDIPGMTSFTKKK
ncbi:MAG: GlcNAc-PI de-N-acetylase [Verrucomicrobiales bacterium]|nr:GlcNAc-PI de-N-acetylase [Verrucomicrobiales bacterium]